MSRCISTSFINSNDQLKHIFTKPLRGPGLATVLRNMVHIIYMLQIESHCCNNSYIISLSHYRITNTTYIPNGFSKAIHNRFSNTDNNNHFSKIHEYYIDGVFITVEMLNLQ